ncbi:unnamed protein product, partial [Polarella glacialis]
MKRPAESELVPEGKGGDGQPQPSFSSCTSFSSSAASGNPFAGISLLGSAPASGSLFAAAASSSASSGFGFGSASAGADAVGFGGAASSAPATKVDAANGQAANPFMGLSLFSTPGATGGLFTAAASTLPQRPSDSAPLGAAASSLGGSVIASVESSQEVAKTAGDEAEASQEPEPEEELAVDEATGGQRRAAQAQSALESAEESSPSEALYLLVKECINLSSAVSPDYDDGTAGVAGVASVSAKDEEDCGWDFGVAVAEAIASALAAFATHLQVQPGEGNMDVLERLSLDLDYFSGHLFGGLRRLE